MTVEMTKKKKKKKKKKNQTRSKVEKKGGCQAIQKQSEEQRAARAVTNRLDKLVAGELRLGLNLDCLRLDNGRLDAVLDEIVEGIQLLPDKALVFEV